MTSGAVLPTEKGPQTTTGAADRQQVGTIKSFPLSVQFLMCSSISPADSELDLPLPRDNPVTDFWPLCFCCLRSRHFKYKKLIVMDDYALGHKPLNSFFDRENWLAINKEYTILCLYGIVSRTTAIMSTTSVGGEATPQSGWLKTQCMYFTLCLPLHQTHARLYVPDGLN